ncbi:MAG: hypothetical protein ISR55_09455 [Bacteroidetes bacterium]|nr:hypothetical protein [Bacteroidota bacterium]
MKKLVILLLLISVTLSQSILAQSLMQGAEVVVTFIMKGDNGNNGTAVTYNPKHDIYYAAFAGNSVFPLETFDKYGKHIDRVKTGFDVRGLWYNSKSKRIEGNAYDGAGLYYKTLNSSGFPDDYAYPIIENNEMPNSNSVGAYSPKKKEIYYLFGKEIKVYKRKNYEYKGSISLDIPYNSKNINTTTILFTGVKNMEFGILDEGNQSLLLFNKKGEHQGSVSINASFSLPEMFNVSFTNGYLFIFNKDRREWLGYQVFRK